jgi:hypothetical protein
VSMRFFKQMQSEGKLWTNTTIKMQEAVDNVNNTSLYSLIELLYSSIVTML